MGITAMMQHPPQPHQQGETTTQYHHHQNGHGQQQSPRSSLHHTEGPDSDDGGQGMSGEDGENDYDDHHQSTRHGGKRKRPISVSYVPLLLSNIPPFCSVPQLCLHRQLALSPYLYVSPDDHLLLLRHLIRSQVGLAVTILSILSCPRHGHCSPCPRLYLPRPHRQPMRRLTPVYPRAASPGVR